jgi:hypothetical protein
MCITVLIAVGLFFASAFILQYALSQLEVHETFNGSVHDPNSLNNFIFTPVGIYKFFLSAIIGISAFTFLEPGIGDLGHRLENLKSFLFSRLLIHLLIFGGIIAVFDSVLWAISRDWAVTNLSHTFYIIFRFFIVGIVTIPVGIMGCIRFFGHGTDN